MLKHSKLDVCGIRTLKYKYFRAASDSTAKNHLYDLTKDPLEENNIAENENEIVQKMEADLKNIQQEVIKSINDKPNEEDHDEKVKKELRKLGYL